MIENIIRICLKKIQNNFETLTWEDPGIFPPFQGEFAMEFMG